MSNPMILQRITVLHVAGEINDAKLASYVEKGIITQAEADAIIGESV